MNFEVIASQKSSFYSHIYAAPCILRIFMVLPVSFSISNLSKITDMARFALKNAIVICAIGFN